MKVLRTFCSFVLGVVFIFSGFVKAVDPAGSAIKFQDYFAAFDITFLDPVALPLAILLSTAELVVGVALLFHLRPRPAAWGALLFMIVFLPLTLILALTNPVSDCGCFGDAIVLTNWETFFKNVVIATLLIPVFALRKKAIVWNCRRCEWTMIAVVTLFTVAFSLYNEKKIPLVDFRPYSTGTNIREKMTVPEDAPRDEYDITLIYEKNGEQREFSLENYPYDDSTWTFVDQKSVLISKGYTPPIHDFSIITGDGEDITDLVLDNSGYSFLMVSYSLQKANTDALEKANRLAMACEMHGHAFYAITSSTDDEVIETTSKMALVFPFNFADETTLKTIIRSNPGILLLHEGTILGKWAADDIPDPEILEKDLLSVSLEQAEKSRASGIYLISGLILLLVFFVFLPFLRRRI